MSCDTCGEQVDADLSIEWCGNCTPTCDTCGQPEQVDADLSIEWCGNCGSCLVHCEKQVGCPPDSALVVRELDRLYW